MKLLLKCALIILFSSPLFAQIPQKMSYQAVIRNSSNVLVSNAPIGMQVSIVQGSASGTVLYSETHQPTSNANGLVTIEVGAGTVVSGTFSTIPWPSGPFFVKTETDPDGGTNYTITGTSQLLSVPFALYAETSGSQLPGPQGIDGKSAYQVWLDLGNTGTEADFIASLTGPQGADGKSAYQIWLDLGNTGTEADFLASFVGPQGSAGAPGTNGTNGTDGDGAYTNWLNQGNTGTEADFLATLVGPQGPPGATLVNGGKHTLILTDDVTDAEAAQQILDEVGPNTQEILIDDCSVLTTIDLSGISKAVRITITDNAVLANVNLGNLTVVYDNFNIMNCPNLATINLSALQKISAGMLYIKNTGITALDLSQLKKVNGGIVIDNNDALTTLTTPLLTTTQYLTIIDNLLLNAVSAPLTTTSLFSQLKVNSNAALTTLSLPGISYSGSVDILSNSLLNALDLAALDSVSQSVVISGNNALTNVSLMNLRKTYHFTFSDASGVINLNLANLFATTNYNSVFTSYGDLTIKNCLSLTTLNLNGFTKTNRFVIQDNPALTALNLPLLNQVITVRIENCTSLSQLDLSLLNYNGFTELKVINSGVTQIKLPLITALSSLQIENNPSLTSIDLASLSYLSFMGGNYMNIKNNTALPTINLPALVTLGSSGASGLDFSGNSNLTSISWPMFSGSLISGFGPLNFTGCKLNSSEVNALLAKFKSNTSPSGNKLKLEGQTPPAPPTGQGITDKATMTSNGWIVTTD